MGIKLNFEKFVNKLRQGSVLNKGISDLAPKQAPSQPSVQNQTPSNAQATPPTPAVQQAPQYDFPPTSSDPRDEAYTRDQIKKSIKQIPDIPKTIKSSVKRGIKNTAEKLNMGETNKNVTNLTSVLPSTIMGEKNYNTAVKKVKQLVRDKKFQEAKSFVDNQLKKLANDGNVHAKQKLEEGGARYRPKVNKK